MQKKFIPTDNITIELLKNYTITNGRNYDVLIRIDNDRITARTLEQLMQDSTCKVDHMICHSPDIFPWIDNTHLKKTFFKDWQAPSFYEHFRESQGSIITETLPQHTIPLEQYIQTAKDRIENNVKNLFANSKRNTQCQESNLGCRQHKINHHNCQYGSSFSKAEMTVTSLNII